jgi:hypothetical protein
MSEVEIPFTYQTSSFSINFDEGSLGEKTYEEIKQTLSSVSSKVSKATDISKYGSISCFLITFMLFAAIFGLI